MELTFLFPTTTFSRLIVIRIRPSLTPYLVGTCGVDVVALKRPIALDLLCIRARAYVRSMMLSPPLVVTWPIASVLHPAPLCAPPVLVLRSPLVPLPLHLLLWIGQWTPKQWRQEKVFYSSKYQWSLVCGHVSTLYEYNMSRPWLLVCQECPRRHRHDH